MPWKVLSGAASTLKAVFACMVCPMGKWTAVALLQQGCAPLSFTVQHTPQHAASGMPWVLMVWQHTLFSIFVSISRSNVLHQLVLTAICIVLAVTMNVLLALLYGTCFGPVLIAGLCMSLHHLHHCKSLAPTGCANSLWCSSQGQQGAACNACMVWSAAMVPRMVCFASGASCWC